MSANIVTESPAESTPPEQGLGVPRLVVRCEKFGYLKGSRTPKQVARDGYGFTEDIAQAWVFPSVKQADAKAVIVERHMGWRPGTLRHRVR